MSAPARKGSLFTAGPDRWLVLAGAGLLVLGLVLRLLTDIGRSTATGDTATQIADTAALAKAPSTTAETLAATPPAPVPPVLPAEPESRATTSAAAPGPSVPKVEKKPTRPAPVASPAGGWSVQLGVFGSAENAARLQSRVAALGYHATVGPAGTLTRVRVVGLADRAAAQLAADSIARSLGTSGLVVSPAH